MLVFHTLSAGNIGQLGAPGSGVPADAVPGAATSASPPDAMPASRRIASSPLFGSRAMHAQDTDRSPTADLPCDRVGGRLRRADASRAMATLPTVRDDGGTESEGP